MEVKKYAQDELKTVFQLCDPNDDGLISLRKLQELFQQHQEKVSKSVYCLSMCKVGNFL